jgi:hypothetical protein
MDMDPNTELLLQKARRVHNWEDEDNSSNDLTVLREEFRKRLYLRPSDRSPRAEPLSTTPDGPPPALE